MKKIIGFLFTIAVLTTGCKQSKKPTETYGGLKAEPNKEAFSEGLLTYELSISDSIVDTFIKTKGVQAPMQLHTLLDNYKGEQKDKLYLASFFQKHTDFFERYGRLPYVKNKVNISGYDVISYKEGLTYLYEVTINELEGIGHGFVGRNRSMLTQQKGVNYSIKKEQIEQVERHFLVIIDESKYTRVERETDLKVAGYEVKEVVYQLKEQLANTVDLSTPVELTVYTSTSISALVNAALPIQLPHEGYGVLRAEVRFRDSAIDPFYFVLEAKAVVVRELLMEEKSLLNYSKDFTALEESVSKELFKGVFEEYIITPTMKSK